MIHKASLVATTLLATAGLAHAADMPAEPVSTSYTYFAVEGGYIHFDAEDVQAFLTSDIPDFNTL